MKIAAIGLLALLPALPLAAQEEAEPTPERESFLIQPGTVKSGAQGVTLRFVANEPGAFSTSSSRSPEVEFGAGVTLVTGSFQLLNQNEATCRADIEDDAVGTVEVGIKLYSVDGSSVRQTLRATLGVRDDETVEGSGVTVGAESVLLVQVNVEEPQQAGAILISGNTAGVVTITAPTGTTFSGQPVATIDNGDINTPQLQDGNTVFRFGIGNANLNDVNVRVGDILLDTALYEASGGGPGNLTCELSGGALSNESILVVNAFTGKAALQGDEEAPEEQVGSQSSESSDETDNQNRPRGGGASLANGNRRSLDDGRTERDTGRGEAERRNRTNFGPRNVNNTQRASRPSGFPASRGPSNNSNAGNTNAPTSRPSNDSARPASSGRGGQGVASTGGMSFGNRTGDRTEETVEKMARSNVSRKEAPKLKVTPGLHFCDEDFRPISAVVLNKLVSGEAGGRVWITLKLEEDRSPGEADTVRVELMVHGTARELILTETGPDTGEYRCREEGILIVANEDPDSNRDDEAKQKPPRPRFTTTR